ncbi:hypothetical protein VTJ83DRAFT_1784 [Remersonia thermophila]|uniref:NADH-ubiquinone oxidoreductase 9.5 kDa subunit n=1 Tax=Remersonia thermophila TaxID=72144 RepID=A0ABR4DGV9_9PEZI
MSGATPRFWAGPLRYCRWAARERPGYFWSVVIGALGPVTLVTVPPLRRAVGDYDAPPIPLTYPVPTGPRKQLTGYDDDTETN